jgi:excisionase family DNA binding protein
MASDLVGDHLRLDSTSQRAEAHVGVAPPLDARGAAALLNVPASWVLAEARADRIPHVRLGRYVRFDAAELQIWWQTRRRGPWRSTRAAATKARAGVTSATTASTDF